MCSVSFRQVMVRSALLMASTAHMQGFFGVLMVRSASLMAFHCPNGFPLPMPSVSFRKVMLRNAFLMASTAHMQCF